MRMRPNVTALAVVGLAGVAWAGAALERDEGWVLERVRQVKESDTRAWQRIPWTASLLEARRVGREENHPVFLFTHDGNIETGRC